MRKLLIGAMLVLSACAGQWKNTYVGGAAVKEFVTHTHKIAWSDPLNERANKCETDAAVASVKEYDACLSPYDRNDEVLKALKVYEIAAHSLTAALLATAPEGVGAIEREVLREEYRKLLRAARELIALFPEAEKYAKQLELITKGL